MKKKNKRVNENGKELENFFDVFMRNYRNVKGFRSFVKLCLYFLIIFLFILFVNLADKELETRNDENPNAYRTTTVAKKKKSYKEILDDVINQKEDVYATLKIKNKDYRIDLTMKDEVSGFIETEEGTKRFKIKEGIIYEVKLNQEIENSHLFDGIKLDFLLSNSLIKMLEAHVSTKMIYDDYTLYTYKLKAEEKEYKIDCTVEEAVLTKVSITAEEEEYEILYE